MSLTARPASRRARGGAAGGDELDAKAGQGAGEVDQAGFVGNAQQGAANLFCIAGARAHGCSPLMNDGGVMGFGGIGSDGSGKAQTPAYNLGPDSRDHAGF